LAVSIALMSASNWLAVLPDFLATVKSALFYVICASKSCIAFCFLPNTLSYASDLDLSGSNWVAI
jgi:hypothetical protein